MTALPSGQVHAATHFPLIAGVLLGGLDEFAPAVKIFIVLPQRHVAVLDEHVWQMRLYSDTDMIAIVADRL